MIIKIYFKNKAKFQNKHYYLTSKVIRLIKSNNKLNNN